MLTTTPKRNPASMSNRSDAVLDRLRAVRRPGESPSDVIIRLIELGGGQRLIDTLIRLTVSGPGLRRP